MQLTKAFSHIVFSLGCLLLGATSVSGQSLSRSGLAAAPEDKASFRRFPCGGETLIDEKFEGDTLPAGWQAFDLDGLTPRPEIQFLVPTGGWQSIADPKDTTSQNRVIASPSWYADTVGASDDWLLLPGLGDLPTNVCLSWYAYSQDVGFSEAYEVIVSTTGGTPADLANGDTLLLVDQELDEFTYRSVSLADYAGQDVWIAFHQSSVDRFLLVLDDIRLAKVEEVDLGMFLLDPISVPAGTGIKISGALINRGLTSIEFDSAELKIWYQINNADPNVYEYPDDETIVFNDTLQFIHDSTWTPFADAVYLMKFWIENISGDTNVANDTLRKWQGIGSKTSLTEQIIPGLRVWYDATGHSLRLNELPATAHNWQLWDSQGRRIGRPQALRQTNLPLARLSPGVYILVLANGAGIQHVQKLAIRP